MDLNQLFLRTQEWSVSAWTQATTALGSGVGYAKTAVGKLWLFGSTEHSDSYAERQCDEKHYLLIPDYRCEAKYSLFVMRCLPDGVPPINDLPKRRIFHLPNEHAMPTIEAILLERAQHEATVGGGSPSLSGSRLSDLADQIDRLDSKLFHGVLLIGGLVALVNPAVGAAVALKAFLPSIGLTLSKYGLNWASDSWKSKQLTQHIQKAEKEVLEQFKKSGTSSLLNPLLQQLDLALRTEEFEYDPVMEFQREQLDFADGDRDRLFHLTCRAITKTYETALQNPKEQSAANLGLEDIRFLKLLREITEGSVNRPPNS